MAGHNQQKEGSERRKKQEEANRKEDKPQGKKRTHRDLSVGAGEGATESKERGSTRAEEITLTSWNVDGG